MTEYQPRTSERITEILRAQDQNPRSWQQEAAAEIERLRAVEEAAAALMIDVKRRYPGEDLRCPFMQKLDAALSNGQETT